MTKKWSIFPFKWLKVIIYLACLSEFMIEAILESSMNHSFELQSLVIVTAWKRVTGLPLFFPQKLNRFGVT